MSAALVPVSSRSPELRAPLGGHLSHDMARKCGHPHLAAAPSKAFDHFPIESQRERRRRTAVRPSGRIARSIRSARHCTTSVVPVAALLLLSVGAWWCVAQSKDEDSTASAANAAEHWIAAWVPKARFPLLQQRQPYEPHASRKDHDTMLVLPILDCSLLILSLIRKHIMPKQRIAKSQNARCEAQVVRHHLERRRLLTA